MRVPLWCASWMLVALLVPHGVALGGAGPLAADPGQPDAAPASLVPATATRASGQGVDGLADGPVGAGAADSPLRFLPGVEWTAYAPQEFTFACPGGPEDGLMDLSDPTDNVVVVRATCPYRIIDEADLLGSPQLAIRHDDVREVAFFSLHGAASSEGPTPRSRDPDSSNPAGGLSHTIFTSRDGGWNWQDNPYGSQGFGETNAGIMDRDGEIFAASLFSRAAGTGDLGEPLFEFHFNLYEANTVKDHVSPRDTRIDSRAAGNVIEEVNLVLVTPPTRIETQAQYEAYRNQTQSENGTAGPADDDDVGNYTIERDPSDFTQDLVAAVWHERAFDWRNATTGKSSWIDIVWKSASERDAWHKMPDDQLVGPCRAASNPVAFNGRVYVACVADAGYNGRRDARIGDIDVWAYDLHEQTKHFMGHVPELGPDGRPRLAASSDGRFAITSTRILSNGPTDFASIELAFGWYGRAWEGVMDLGNAINTEWEPAQLRDARVTAMALLEEPHVLYLSFMERINGTVQAESQGSLVEYRKMLGTWERCSNQPVALYDLNVGVARHPFQEGIVNDITGVFDDLHDGMAVAVDPETGYQRVYFAYGDHGVIQYGAINALSGASGGCPAFPPPPLYTFVPATPSALLLGSGVGLGTATALTSAAALMLGSLLISKRRVSVAAATKAK